MNPINTISSQYTEKQKENVASSKMPSFVQNAFNQPKTSSSQEPRFFIPNPFAPVKGLGRCVWDLIETSLYVASDPIDNALYPMAKHTLNIILILDYKTSHPDHPPSWYKKLPEMYDIAVEESSTILDQFKTIAKDFQEGDINKKIEMIAYGAGSIRIPGWLVKELKLSLSNKVNYGTFSTKLFHNIRPEHVIQGLNIENMTPKLKTLTGEHTLLYVVLENGELLTSSRNYRPDVYEGIIPDVIIHPELASSRAVRASGEVKLIDGEIIEINDQSGHYRTYGSEAAALHAFKKHGLKGDFVHTTWHDHSKKPIVTYDNGPFSFVGMGFGFVSGMNSDFEPNFDFINEASAEEPEEDFFAQESQKTSSQKTEENQEEKKVNKTVDDIKQTIKDAKTPEEKEEAVKKIEEMVKKFATGTNLEGKFTKEEMAFFDELYSQTMEKMSKSTSQYVRDTFDSINAIFDKRALLEKNYDGTAVPFMNTLATIFTFIEPKKGFEAQKAVTGAKLIVDGATGMFDILSASGLAGIMDTAFSLASGNFFSGLAGLLGLFGEQTNPNAEVLHTLHEISNQINRLHIDVIEGFRHMSLCFEHLGNLFTEGFKLIFRMHAKYHEEVMSILRNIEKVGYINIAYSDLILDAVENIQDNEYIQSINDSDWSEVVSEVESDCNIYKNSMSLSLLRKHLSSLVKALNKSQRNSIARAKINSKDAKKVYERLSVASQFVGKGEKDPTDQNIHLLRAYIMDKFKGNSFLTDMPSEYELHNPQAVIEIFEVAEKLYKTYQKNHGYLGVPSEVSETFGNFYKALVALEEFNNVLSNQEIQGQIKDSFSTTFTKFSALMTNQITHAMFTYHKEHGHKRNMDRLETYSNMIVNMEKIKNAVKLDYTNWFTRSYQTAMTDIGWNFWKDRNGNRNTNHEKKWNANPQFSNGAKNLEHEPTLAKSSYTEIYKSQVNLLIEKAVLEINKMSEIEIQAHRYENIGTFSHNIFLLSGVDEEKGLNNIHYFLDQEGIPLPVKKEQLLLIPSDIRKAHDLGLCELQFSWKKSEGQMTLEAHVVYEKGGDSFKEILFKQTVAAHNKDFLSAHQSTFFSYYGGKGTNGMCDMYDMNLKRYTSLKDTVAVDEYTKNYKPWSLFHHNLEFANEPHMVVRNTVCYPIEMTYEPGVITTDFVAGKETVDPIIEVLKAGENQIRKKIMNEFYVAMKTGKVGNEEIAETVADLNLKAHVAKVILKNSLGYTPLDATQIMEEINRYKGNRVNPLHLVQSMEKLVLSTPLVIKNPGSPYVNLRQSMEKVVQEIQTETVNPILAETRCEGILECKKLSETKEFNALLNEAPKHIKNQWTQNHLGFGFPQAQATSCPSYDVSTQENYYLVRVALHYVMKWMPGNWECDVPDRKALENHLDQLQKSVFEIGYLKSGLVKKTGLFDDVFRALNRYTKDAIEMAEDALKTGKTTKNRLAEIERLTQRTQELIDDLDNKESMLMEWKAESKDLPENQRFVIGYNCFKGELTREIETIEWSLGDENTTNNINYIDNGLWLEAGIRPTEPNIEYLLADS